MFRTHETKEAREASLNDARGANRETVMSTITRKVIDGHVTYVREPAGTLGEIWDKAKADGVEGICLGRTDYKETGLVDSPYDALGFTALADEVVLTEISSRTSLPLQSQAA